MATEAWIIDAVRTPRGIGKPGKGALAGIHPHHLLVPVLQSLIERSGVNSADIDDVIAGCNTQQGKQSLDIARMAVLDAGIDPSVPGFALDRFCGSGLSAVNLAAQGLMSGTQQMVVAGGVESMSHNQGLQREFMLDTGNLRLRERYVQPHQGLCADLIATLQGFTREQLDGFALQSQQRAAVAIEEGRFSRSLVPVYHEDGSVALDHEEFPRPQTSLEALAQLRPAFEAVMERPVDDAGTTFADLLHRVYPDLRLKHLHTAGTSSGVVDGAGGLLLASPEYARANGLEPRARIRALTTVGGDPTLMLDAPGPAARKVLALAGLTVKDIDLFEVNEAFAVVPLKFMRDLDVDPARVNVNGGAIALGHPIGATGAILLGTLLDELERRDLQFGLVTMCTAGGMAPATLIERI